MTLLHWGPALQVGFGDIDAQHRRLVGLVNTLDDAMCAGRDRDVLGTVLAELVRYTTLHFAYEEKLMTRHGLADHVHSAEHRVEHERLRSEVETFQRDFILGDADVSQELLDFLRNWLADHILGTDKGLATALLAAGAVSAA